MPRLIVEVDGRGDALAAARRVIAAELDAPPESFDLGIQTGFVESLSRDTPEVFR